MNRKSLILTLTIALVMSVPASTAAWISHGNQEPSTSYDTPGYMPRDPNTGRSNVVYFNAFETHQVASSQNPNIGTLESRVQPFPAAQFDAILGIWKDCNGDGYLGLAESAVAEYRTELLLADDICPQDGMHNDGEWVYEYLTFGNVDPCAWAGEERHANETDPCYLGNIEKNPGVIYVNNTRIWGNIGRPDRIDAPAATCAISPIPKGTTSSTGLFIRYGECIASLATHINTVDETTGGVLGLGFDDTENPQRDADHPLNRGLPVNLYGNPVEGQDGETGLIQEDDPQNGRDAPSAFTTWDCSGERNSVRDPTAPADGTGSLYGIPVQDPTGIVPHTVADPTGEFGEIELTDEDGTFFTLDFTDENGEIVSVPALNPSAGNPTGSYFESAGDAMDGFDDCDDSNGNDLDGSNGASLLDSPNEGTAGAPARRQSDLTFYYGDGVADAFIDILAPFVSEMAGIFVDEPVTNPLGARTPYDGGLTGLRWYTGASWYSTPNYITYAPMVNGRTDLEPAEGNYYSFFAAVDMQLMSDEGFVLPGGSSTSYVYGAEQCGDLTTGTQNGWDCDPTTWYKDATGTNTAETYTEGEEISVRVGAFYQLRDVDCFDNHLAAGVYAGTFKPCE